MRLNRDVNFKEEDYEEFYADHFFAPIPDQEIANAHRIFPRVAWALDIAQEIQPKKVLDIGCLEGYAVMTVAKHVPSVEQGVGVDLSKDGIEMATTHAERESLPCTFSQGTLEDFMSKSKEKFDLIMAFEIMEHVKDPVETFKLIDKVLAPGGTVLISTPDFEAPTYGKDDEANKCHIRLYTTADEDYEGVNKFGNTRLATSLSKQVGKERIISMEVFSELIHARYR
jgi:2-polyprenyl-3-methyl-5-hydroxy-6-metoxy-1,4-benzoquinol methylase